MWGATDPAVIATLVTGNVDYSSPSPIGSKGEKGNAGAEGPMGLQGRQGVAGAASAPGPIGPAGTSSWADGSGMVSTMQRVGVGTNFTNIGAALNGIESFVTINDPVNRTMSNDTPAQSANVVLRRQRSNNATVLQGDRIGQFIFRGFDGTQYSNGAAVGSEVESILAPAIFLLTSLF